MENYPLDKYSNIPVFKRIIFASQNLWAIKRDYDFIESELKKKDTWEIVENTGKPKQNIVIVIGESVRRDMLHAYGFPIKNTQFIESSPNILFDNYITTGCFTMLSLKRILALSNNLVDYQLSNDIVSLAKKIGYKTYWISNQASMGIYDTPVAVIGKKSGESHFYDKRIQDHDMLPYFDKILNNNDDSPKLIVLHMKGSHPKICHQTGGKYDEYVLSNEISCYNKTIKNLDYFLEHIYKGLKNKKDSFGLIYFSDHGLVLSENEPPVHGKVKNAYDVPLIIWGDDIEKSKKIEAYRSAQDFLHLFCELVSIKTKNINKSYQFISEENAFPDSKIKVLKDENSAINYEDLKDNSIHSLLKKEK